MRYLLTSLLCVFSLSLTAQEVVTYPYNPDEDVNGLIASPDLLSLLAGYGEVFSPGEILIDGVSLLEVIQDLQNQINNNTLPDGTLIGDLLIWNGTAWMPGPPPVDDCGVYGGDGSSCALTPITDENIHAAVDVWISNEYEADAMYGHISDWDVSIVTNMDSLFIGAAAFNSDISSWDVLSVTSMRSMFDGARDFNGDLSSWDVSSVTNMSFMFNKGYYYYNYAFNGDLSSWDVSSVTNMSSMFNNAHYFHSDLSSWDVSSVTNMSSMFYGANSFNGDLSSWDVSSVTNMSSMFNMGSSINCSSFNSDLSSWDVSSVTNMSSMFNTLTYFNGDLSSWDASSVTNMSSMFKNAYFFNGDISSWDVSSVTNMYAMFDRANFFNGDISSWDVSSVTSMRSMFDGARDFNGDISSWDVSSVTDMKSMFDDARDFNGDISSWDVSSVTNMSSMFDGASDLSEENQCLIHISFSSNSNWPYDWSEFCVEGCDGILFSGLVNDECGVCGGDNSTCLDECGVPNGDNTTCIDNCGILNGTNDCISCGDAINHEGYDYSTVQIGDQCWFSENCRYLPSVSPSSEGSETDPYYYVYGYEETDVAAAQDTTNYETYGVLYNWPAVMTEGICPSGWHIPSDGEFTELTDFLGGESVAGDAMKSTSGWNNDGNGSNSSGFNGLPGGYCVSGGFEFNGYIGHWWSASESGSDSWKLSLLYDEDYVSQYYSNRDYGFSARCVRD